MRVPIHHNRVAPGEQGTPALQAMRPRVDGRGPEESRYGAAEATGRVCETATQGSAGPTYTVLAFDSSGNRRVPTTIIEGDKIEWKRNGQRGTVWLRVEMLWRTPKGVVKVYARPLTGGRRLCIKRGIHHVISPKGYDRLTGAKRLC